MLFPVNAEPERTNPNDDAVTFVVAPPTKFLTKDVSNKSPVWSEIEPLKDG